MTLTAEQIKQLDQPLDPRRVSKREGGRGKSLSYLQSHDVKRTANRIFGYAGWSYTVHELICLGEEPFTNKNNKQGIRVGYRAVVTVSAGGVDRGDVGYGDAMEYTGSRITPHELAAKEAVSDATKRCLASFGDQFGLVLYGDDPIKDSPAATGTTAAHSQPAADDAGAAAPAAGEHPAQTTSEAITTAYRKLEKAIGETNAQSAYALALHAAGLQAGATPTYEQAQMIIGNLELALPAQVPAA